MEMTSEVNVLHSVANKQVDRAFNFDKVFGPELQQRSIYDQAIATIVHEVLEGFSCTVFAYGQIGTGKTYTMEGGMRKKLPLGGDLPAEAGVIPRAVRHIFDTLELQNEEVFNTWKRTASSSILMDFGSARPSRKQIRSRQEALQLQEWTSEHCSAPFRAPELWDCPSHADIDERTDIWSLGCTLYAIMYGMSLQLAIVNAQIKWPNTGPKASYPEALHQFVTWMLQPQAAVH